MPKTNPLIGVREASYLLDTDKQTVIRWINRGDLRVVHKLPGKNGAILLDRAAVEKLAARLATGASA